MYTLNPLEEELMHLFWKLEKAFPKEIIAYLSEPQPPYNTVLSTIRKLEKEGLLAHKKFGKSHQYFPLVDKASFNKSFFKKFYHKYMDSNKLTLLSYFMEEEDIEVDELKKLLKNLK